MALPNVMRCLTAAKAASLGSMSTSRILSTRCSNSVHKLRRMFDECRAHDRCIKEMPSRFKTEVVNAAQENSLIAPEGLDRILSNIGAAKGLSQSDKDVIFSELGECGTIPVHRFVQMIYSEDSAF